MCACSRCQKEISLDLHKSGIMCKCQKGYFVIGTKKCSSCGKELDYSDWKKNNETIDKIGHYLEEGGNKEMQSEVESALKAYLNAWELSRQLFHIYNTRNIALNENIVWCYIQLGKFKEAHPYCTQLLDITKQSLPYFTSFCAITEYKLSKIELNIGYLNTALKYMVHSYKTLQLTHADFPEFLQQLSDTINQLTAELSQQNS
jgi:tetratricopeptide (TPR) repeat protein